MRLQRGPVEGPVSCRRSGPSLEIPVALFAIRDVAGRFLRSRAGPHALRAALSAAHVHAIERFASDWRRSFSPLIPRIAPCTRSSRAGGLATSPCGAAPRPHRGALLCPRGAAPQSDAQAAPPGLWRRLRWERAGRRETDLLETATVRALRRGRQTARLGPSSARSAGADQNFFEHARVDMRTVYGYYWKHNAGEARHAASTTSRMYGPPCPDASAGGKATAGNRRNPAVCAGEVWRSSLQSSACSARIKTIFATV